MPQLGETVTEGTITRWLKQVGDSVAEDDLLFEVSTDKVDSEVPSPVAGVLTEILVPEGDTVDVGTRLAVISDGADGATPKAAPQAAAQPQPRTGGRGWSRNRSRSPRSRTSRRRRPWRPRQRPCPSRHRPRPPRVAAEAPRRHR